MKCTAYRACETCERIFNIHYDDAVYGVIVLCWCPLCGGMVDQYRPEDHAQWRRVEVEYIECGKVRVKEGK